jgi:tricarballylate dehydrogenase
MVILKRYHVVVVGSGLAGLMVAVSAAEAGRSVVVLDAAGPDASGGNTRYSIGVLRLPHAGLQDLRSVVTAEEDWERVAAEPYSAGQFFEDLRSATRGEGDLDLLQVVVDRAREAVEWLKKHGVELSFSSARFAPAGGDGQKAKLAHGIETMISGQGIGLLRQLTAVAQRLNVEFIHGATAEEVIFEGGAVTEIVGRNPEGVFRLHTQSVVVATGSFDSCPTLRARHLGPWWDEANIRGGMFNTGLLLESLLRNGAAPAGQWSGVHAVAADPGAPACGDSAVGDVFGRYSYPFGISINEKGERFFDEGANIATYTYASIGMKIYAQPNHRAWQIFDARGIAHLEARYARSEPIRGDSLAELASKLPLQTSNFLRVATEFNSACPLGEFRADRPDGLAAHPRNQPPKSNWAVPIQVPPFRAYPVEPLVTFTFGGLKVDGRGRVMSTAGTFIPGLYACGEAVGAFAHNVPAGTDMVKTAVTALLVGSSVAGDELPRWQLAGVCNCLRSEEGW